MAEGSVTYVYPAWGLIPLVGHKFHGVHARVAFSDDSGNLEVVHNLAFPWGAPLQEPEWVAPLVVVNPLTASPKASVHTVKVKDGNTLEIGRAASGPDTAVTYDVWIFRPKTDSSWFS
jgi:LysM repeat protein